MKHVFISYKHPISDFMIELVSRLKGGELSVWIDREGIRIGQKWREQITLALESAFALVVILTPEAKRSEYVTYEWSSALARGIPVLPIMLIQTELPAPLADLHYLDFSGEQSPWDELVTELQALHRSSQVLGAANHPEAIPRDPIIAFLNAPNALSGLLRALLMDELLINSAPSIQDMVTLLGSKGILTIEDQAFLLDRLYELERNHPQ